MSKDLLNRAKNGSYPITNLINHHNKYHKDVLPFDYFNLANPKEKEDGITVQMRETNGKDNTILATKNFISSDSSNGSMITDLFHIWGIPNTHVPSINNHDNDSNMLRVSSIKSNNSVKIIDNTPGKGIKLSKRKESFNSSVDNLPVKETIRTETDNHNVIMNIINLEADLKNSKSEIIEAIPYSDVFILTYDVCNKESFNNILSYYNMILDYKNGALPREIPILLIGNMIDCMEFNSTVFDFGSLAYTSDIKFNISRNRQVSVNDGINLSNILKIPFTESSSKFPNLLDDSIISILLECQRKSKTMLIDGFALSLNINSNPDFVSYGLNNKKVNYNDNLNAFSSCKFQKNHFEYYYYHQLLSFYNEFNKQLNRDKQQDKPMNLSKSVLLARHNSDSSFITTNSVNMAPSISNSSNATNTSSNSQTKGLKQKLIGMMSGGSKLSSDVSIDKDLLDNSSVYSNHNSISLNNLNVDSNQIEDLEIFRNGKVSLKDMKDSSKLSIRTSNSNINGNEYLPSPKHTSSSDILEMNLKPPVTNKDEDTNNIQISSNKLNNDNDDKKVKLTINKKDTGEDSENNGEVPSIINSPISPKKEVNSRFSYNSNHQLSIKSETNFENSSLESSKRLTTISITRNSFQSSNSSKKPRFSIQNVNNAQQNQFINYKISELSGNKFLLSNNKDNNNNSVDIEEKEVSAIDSSKDISIAEIIRTNSVSSNNNRPISISSIGKTSLNDENNSITNTRVSSDSSSIFGVQEKDNKMESEIIGTQHPPKRHDSIDIKNNELKNILKSSSIVNNNDVNSKRNSFGIIVNNNDDPIDSKISLKDSNSNRTSIYEKSINISLARSTTPINNVSSNRIKSLTSSPTKSFISNYSNNSNYSKISVVIDKFNNLIEKEKKDIVEWEKLINKNKKPLNHDKNKDSIKNNEEQIFSSENNAEDEKENKENLLKFNNKTKISLDDLLRDLEQFTTE